MSSTAFNFRVNSAGRTSLPVGVRKEAGINGEVDVVAYAEGPGRIVIETKEAVFQRIWEMAPAPSGVDAGKVVRQMRDEDRALSDARFASRSKGDLDLAELNAFVAELGL